MRRAGSEMSVLPILENAFLVVKDGLIQDYGKMDQMPQGSVDLILDASNRFVFPSFVDSHSHIVYAASREQEFVQKIQGLSYQQIARQRGGILNSATKLQNTSEENLYDQALARV